MSLRVVGAGLGRTGTHSLKLAFEQLLGGPCYHMLEVLSQPGQAAVWAAAAEGEAPDWDEFLAAYVATVDWPAAAFWQELLAANPEALVVLSVRDPDAWWTSASQTILAIMERGAPPEAGEMGEQLAQINRIIERRFTPEWRDRDAAIRAYEAHNAEVRAAVTGSQLVEWHPGDGWEPLCAALGLDVPRDPFPHVNTTSEFRAMAGLDA